MPSATTASAPATTRLSTHAVLGAGLVLLSLAICGISAGIAISGTLSAAAGILLTPFMGMLGAGLGFYALLQIQRAKGAVIGRGPATFALFVGLLSAILQGSFAAGPGRVWWDIKSKLAPQTEVFMKALAANQLPTARGFLADSADKALTDAQLTAFFAATTAQLGAFQSADATIQMFNAIRELGAGITTRGGTGATPVTPPKPVYLTFDKGPALAFLSLDDVAARNDMIRYTDLLIVLPNNTCITLLPDKDAATVATGLGLKPLEWR